MAAHLSDEWVAALVVASADREGAALDGVVELTLGKTKRAVVEIKGGRVIGASEREPAVTIPFTGKQLDAWLDGGFDLTVAYMKGDLKPEGSTGALLAVLDVLDDTGVRERLRAALAG